MTALPAYFRPGSAAGPSSYLRMSRMMGREDVVSGGVMRSRFPRGYLDTGIRVVSQEKHHLAGFLYAVALSFQFSSCMPLL